MIWKGAARPMSAGEFARAAEAIGCDAATIKAVFEVESGGRSFRADRSLERRFEPHKAPRELWPALGFDPGGRAPWRASLKLRRRRREEMFAACHERRPAAALQATSWGGPQIMGANHIAAGFRSAENMVAAMAAGEDAQLAAFVAFCEAEELFTAFRARDWPTIARRYNGPGQADKYARRMESAYRRLTGKKSPAVLRRGDRGGAVRKLQTALAAQGLELAVDGDFGRATEEALRAFQARAGVTVDGVAGARTWAALKRRGAPSAAVQPDNLDRGLALAERGAGVAGAVSMGAGGLVRDMPESAVLILTIGAVVGVLGFGAFFVARKWRAVE